MPTYFIQGYVQIDPPSHADDVIHALNRHGAYLTSSSADRGSSHFRVSESVEAPSGEAAIDSLKSRIAMAVERRRRTDNVQRFSVGPLIPEYLSPWLADDAFGNPQLGSPKRIAHS
jgi:hypothetical protein